MSFLDRLRVVFAVTLGVQFVIIALHDLIDIRGWVHGSQVKAVIGTPKVYWATAINSLFPGLAAALAIAALFGPVPHFAARCAITPRALRRSACCVRPAPHKLRLSERRGSILDSTAGLPDILRGYIGTDSWSGGSVRILAALSSIFARSRRRPTGSNR